MTIVPMRDLKNTTKIEELCVTSKAPVFVTKNGYGSLVVMDIELFEKIMRQAYEAKMVNSALKEMEEGKLSDGHKVLEELKTKYGF